MSTPLATKPPLTWLITGCSSGFGLSLVRILLTNNQTVIATSRNPSSTPDLLTEVESKGGKWLQLDVTSPTTPSLITSLEASGTHVDVLVNNAGYSIFGPIESLSEDEIRAQMETLYFGPLRLIKAALPYMRERRRGVIVNFSSGASLDGNEKTHHPCPLFLGTFNTNFGNAAMFGKDPFPEDYKGSVAERMVQAIGSGKLVPNGDKDKAMKAVYEVVVGEDAGTGKEAERFLPLGMDMTVRVKGLRDQLEHSLEVFGELANRVAVDK